MSKFNTCFTTDVSKFKYTFNSLPSETRQSDFEPLSKLVARVIRGEILPQLKPEDFELDGTENVQDVFDSPDKWDTPGYDFGDAGSPYQDDIMSEIQQLNQGVKQTTPKQEINPQEEQSGASISSSSDAQPVE